MYGTSSNIKMVLVVVPAAMKRIHFWMGFWQDNGGGQRSVLFTLEAGSPAICLLIQFEKHVTEEGGVTPSVYTRKDPVSGESSL